MTRLTFPNTSNILAIPCSQYKNNASGKKKKPLRNTILLGDFLAGIFEPCMVLRGGAKNINAFSIRTPVLEAQA